jgi:hypothetical protein
MQQSIVKFYDWLLHLVGCFIWVISYLSSSHKLSNLYRYADSKLDSLRPGSREMERGRWKGQNFQLKEVQRLEEEDLYRYSQNTTMLYYQVLYNVSTTCFGHYLAIVRLY